jgi:hypothetical protein
LRHDLHARSRVFGYVMKQPWTRDNPVHRVGIPSDAEAVRIHVLRADEEKHYFRRAIKHKDLPEWGALLF